MPLNKSISQNNTDLVIKQVNGTSPVDLKAIVKKNKYFKYLYEDGGYADVYVIPRTTTWVLWVYSEMQDSDIFHIGSGEECDPDLTADILCICGRKIPKAVKVFSALMGINNGYHFIQK